MDEVKEYQKNNVKLFGVRYPNCQLDGRYAAVQEDETTYVPQDI